MVQTPPLYVLVSNLQFSRKGIVCIPGHLLSPFHSNSFLFVEKEYRRCLPSFTKERKEFIGLKLRNHKKMENSKTYKEGWWKIIIFILSTAYYVTWTSILYLQSLQQPRMVFDIPAYSGENRGSEKWLASSAHCNRTLQSGNTKVFWIPMPTFAPPPNRA